MASNIKLWLFNCTRCDDLQRVVERKRACECGGVNAYLDVNSRPVLTGSGRLILIPWEEYDGAVAGGKYTWTICARA